MTPRRAALGLQRGTVRIVLADPAWPDVFRAEAERLQSCVVNAGCPSLTLEHVGGTSVSGLPSKPIIDMMAGYGGDAHPRDYFPGFLDAGYEHRGPQGIANRELFVLGAETRRTHHLNLVPLTASASVSYLQQQNIPFIGGDASIASIPGQGTEVELRVPRPR